MFCSDCGARISDGTRFCPECGAPQAPTQAGGTPPRDRAVIHTPAPEDPYLPGPDHVSSMRPVPPRKGPSPAVWVALACVAIVVIVLAVALPMLLLRGGGTEDTTTTALSTTSTSEDTTTTEESTTTTEATTTSSEPAEVSTSITGKPGPGVPGDSGGTWTETSITGLDLTVNEVAVSDDALLFQAGTNGVYAYVFESGKTIGLPTAAEKAGGIALDGMLAVWWEANGTDPVTDAHIYAMLLPDGPKVEVASGTSVAYPQVAGGMITWVEGQPWATQPDEWYDYTIKGVSVDETGSPVASASVLVKPGRAIASTVGDSTWVYSLSEGFIAWEQQNKAGAIKPGTWMMDLAELKPWRIGADAWRPSLYKNRVVFTLDGVETAKFSGKAQTIDGAGDYATAAPTYAAFYRPKPSGDGTAWAVVAKGYTGGYQQVLLDDTGSPPWFLPSIAASAHRIAFSVDGALHLFTWQE